MFINDSSVRIFEDREDDGKVRVIIGDKIVIKLFDKEQGELFSIKIWSGDIDRIASFWSMDEVVRDLTRNEVRLIDRALNHARHTLLE